MSNLFTCFSLRLAGFLMQKGFVPVEIRKDFKSERYVFGFNKSKELVIAIESYKNV